MQHSIDVFTDYQIHVQKPIHTIARLAWRRNADPGGKYFEVALELEHPVFYLPGQYLNIVLDGQRRSYSITNLPDTATTQLILLVERLDGGLASSFLDSAAIGTPVEVVLPFGRLVPQAEKTHRHILVATGSGIASLRPIAEWLYKQDGQLIALLWGLRHRTNIFWQDVFDTFAADSDKFRYAITLTQPDDDWRGLVGRVTDHITDIPFDPESYFYLCGGKAMLDDMRAILKVRGVSASHILTEQFHI
ncbi:MAG: FAD-binding oxidoreductase [Chlorobi bacterium]|nr:FAD-binding oxidoreductase [Chlorobiota bacterium]